MPCVLVGLRPIARHQQLIVAICLDVEITFLRKPDDLHRQVVRYAVVENRLAARKPHLRPLVADDGSIEAEPARPRQRPGERPAGARDHLDAGRDDLRERLDVARIEVQPGVDDGPVEVQCEQFVLS
jgi:hypothetical protein